MSIQLRWRCWFTQFSISTSSACAVIMKESCEDTSISPGCSWKWHSLTHQRSYTSENQAEFEILFSAILDMGELVSSWSGIGQCLWQDVQVLVSQWVRTHISICRIVPIVCQPTTFDWREKKVGFTDQEPQKSTCRALERVKVGKFCDLITLNENSRLCQSVRGGRLFKDSPQQLKQIVKNE